MNIKWARIITIAYAVIIAIIYLIKYFSINPISPLILFLLLLPSIALIIFSFHPAYNPNKIAAVRFGAILIGLAPLIVSPLIQYKIFNNINIGFALGGVFSFISGIILLLRQFKKENSPNNY